MVSIHGTGSCKGEHQVAMPRALVVKILVVKFRVRVRASARL